MNRQVRVRFAPSPTGALHLGGVRTALYNYLFARAHGGSFILRIEDTDSTRYVPGAEQYILDSLQWCGVMPDESPLAGGSYAPYRQSERKHLYKQYAEQLVASGYAYYAFDTPEELEQMHQNGNGVVQYDASIRQKMRNSLTLPPEEVQALIEGGVPYVIRIKMTPHQTVTFTDMIRGEISFDTTIVDDKVLLKRDGMPTYHLAVVVDDYLMQITHAFRGEEWLPSAPVHLLLWQYLGIEADMPQWAHLPLILKPDGHGKLSKRDGDRLGFPVFPLSWHDPAKQETANGYREMGFLPQAFVNMLALLGWNDGSGEEIFSITELIHNFNINRVHKAGAKFDYEKAKWFNHKHIQLMDNDALAAQVKPFLTAKDLDTETLPLATIVGLVKERCSLLTDFYYQTHYFYTTPTLIAIDTLRQKWNDKLADFFNTLAAQWATATEWNEPALEALFNTALTTAGIKKGDALLPLRLMLVGDKHGPSVMRIAHLIGQPETLKRIQNTVMLIGNGEW